MIAKAGLVKHALALICSSQHCWTTRLCAAWSACTTDNKTADRYIMLLLLPWLLLTTAAALTSHAPMRVLETPTLDEIDACAMTMCGGFWKTSQLAPAQIAALHRTQADDFRTRFAGKRRMRGALLALPDDEGVAAMASLELGLIDVVTRTVLPRDDAERKFIKRIERLTPRDRNALLREPVQDMCAALFDGNVRIVPLVSNVAVRPAARRRGLGRHAMRACADLAIAWDYDEVVLEVEAANHAACALYEALGFQELWRDTRSALAIEPAVKEGPPLRRRPDVEHVCMWRGELN